MRKLYHCDLIGTYSSRLWLRITALNENLIAESLIEEPIRTDMSVCVERSIQELTCSWQPRP